WVAGSAWNRWSDAHGMGGQMTVESASMAYPASDSDFGRRNNRHRFAACSDSISPQTLGDF
ncbi:hypothetical protein, partial [Pseudomonas monteilii]|uniref:hypothetical protein n=1 Tax=Pseudomonas monteilii TaxID=76759 RepID=UPI001E31F518